MVIISKGRLIQYGYEFIEHICEKTGTEIEIIDNTEESDQKELIEDLIQIITAFSTGLYGKDIKELINALKKDGDNYD